MNCMELDARLIELETQCNRKNKKYAELEEEIEELEGERDSLGHQIYLLEQEIEKTRNMLLDQALMVFDGAEVNLYTKDEKSPVLLENENITVLLMPMSN